MTKYLMKIDTAKSIAEVVDFAHASRHLMSEQNRIGYMGPNDHTVWPRSAKLYEYLGGPVVAHVSQNGKVWAGDKWSEGAAPLYVPS